MSGKPYRVLIADDEEGLRFVLSRLLKREACEVDEAGDGQTALEMAAAKPYDLYILDIKMPKVDGMEVLRQLRRRQPEALIVMMTAFGSQKLAIDALQAGAYDYFTKPFEVEELRVVLRRALEKQALLKKLHGLEQRLEGEGEGFGRLIGASSAMQRVYDMIRRVSAHDVTVLITGESGTGKELVAEAIHENGVGADKPFIRVNCAAIPESLLESELFGHDKGAFTGAVAARPGKFEMADGGSILLDEIGEMPLSLQAKLLRVLQEKRVERIGETKSRPINVRIMTATHRDLSAMVKEQRFREDLFFRINVLPIHVPPLRERVEDIAPLVDHFIAKMNLKNGRTVAGITPEAMMRLEAHDWPGNVRELENAVQRAIVMAGGRQIDVDALPAAIAEAPPSRAPGGANGGAGETSEPAPTGEDAIGPLQELVDQVVEKEEKRLIVAALRKMNYRRQETADLLGISRKSLHNKMTKYDLMKKSSD